MKQISFSILLLFLLLCCSSVYGQKTIKKNSDSVATNKTISKSNFTSRQAVLLKSKKSLNHKINKRTNLSKEDYLKLKDSLTVKRKISLNSLYLQKRNYLKDTLNRMQATPNKQIGRNFIKKSDSSLRKQVIRKH